MTVALALVVVTLAGFLTGVTGFGFSVLSVPLLLMLYPPRDVVVIALCLVVVTSAMLVLAPGLRGQLDLRLCAVLTVFSLLGLPLGSLIFTYVDPRWVSGMIGVILVGFAAHGLTNKRAGPIHRAWVAPSGVLGGLLATSTGLSGPAVAMYVTRRRLSAPGQVATMAAYVGVVSLLGLALLAVGGGILRSALRDLPWLAPASLVGVAAGRWWARGRQTSIATITLYALGLMGAWTVARILFSLFYPGGTT